jgi:flagellar biosynthesis protein FlhF
LSAKRLVLIDTAGVSPSDERSRELLHMLQHPRINRLVVVNAAAQGETIEDQLTAYGAMGPVGVNGAVGSAGGVAAAGEGGARGVILTKLDEAVKLAPALDAVMRARLPILAVANGQRVPQDWHRLSAQALVQRALRSTAARAWRLEGADINLIFSALPDVASAHAMAPLQTHLPASWATPSLAADRPNEHAQ